MVTAIRNDIGRLETVCIENKNEISVVKESLNELTGLVKKKKTKAETSSSSTPVYSRAVVPQSISPDDFDIAFSGPFLPHLMNENTLLESTQTYTPLVPLQEKTTSKKRK